MSTILPDAEAGQSEVAPLREALPPSRPVAPSLQQALPSCLPSEEKHEEDGIMKQKRMRML